MALIKKNMGGMDRIIRFVVVLLIVSLYYFEILEGFVGYILIALVVAFFFTNLTGFCPFYKSVNINSRSSRDLEL